MRYLRMVGTTLKYDCEAERHDRPEQRQKPILQLEQGTDDGFGHQAPGPVAAAQRIGEEAQPRPGGEAQAGKGHGEAATIACPCEEQRRNGLVRVGERIAAPVRCRDSCRRRSEEHTSELQSLMRISYAVFCLKKKKK